MMLGKYGTPRATLNQPDSDTPIRRRNYSLGAQPQSQKRSIVQPQCPPISSYRRHNRLQIKIDKFKAMKGSTKLCQDNISSYVTLKKQVTSKNLTEDSQPVMTRKTPQLFISNLGTQMAGFRPMRQQQKTPTRKRSKTQGIVSQIGQNQRGGNIGLMKSKYKIPLKPLNKNSPKQYCQLSLREIVQNNQSHRFNMRIKLDQIAHRKKSISQSRRPSDDYSLGGWQGQHV